MGVIAYERHAPAEPGASTYILERYADGTAQRVDPLQDAYQAWLGLGNQPTIINDPPTPVIPVADPGDAALVAVQQAAQTLADYARANPEQALPIVQRLADAVGGGSPNA